MSTTNVKSRKGMPTPSFPCFAAKFCGILCAR
jgi:hypothetical protein